VESRLFIDMTPADRYIIIKPRQIRKGALKAFRNTLHDIIPELRNVSHEEIEKLIDEQNTGVFDSR
jgi:hypothetical protein